MWGPQQIAEVCHEANRAYCKTIGDESQVPWDQAPEWQKTSALKGVELHLAQDVPASASHESWMREKLETGWKYGPVKDVDKKEHPCIVPFHELPDEQQRKDFLFRAIVHAFSSRIT